METSQYEAAGAAFWGQGTVSTGNPGDGLTDRPKMAEALASLKEGLGESDDPLYDGWKLRKGAGDAADNRVAVGEGHPSDAEATDTVPVRVVRYLVFPKWAIVVAAALLVFAGIVTVVRLGFRASGSATPAPTIDSPSVVPREVPIELAKPAPTITPSVASAPASAPSSHKVKGKKAKTQDPGFFHDPGF